MLNVKLILYILSTMSLNLDQNNRVCLQFTNKWILSCSSSSYRHNGLLHKCHLHKLYLCGIILCNILKFNSILFYFIACKLNDHIAFQLICSDVFRISSHLSSTIGVTIELFEIILQKKLDFLLQFIFFKTIVITVSLFTCIASFDCLNLLTFHTLGIALIKMLLIFLK